MTYPKVAIIILNWNGLEDTIECLESLQKITYPNYEVIVVDNGSEGNDVEVLREKFGEHIHLIENDRNYGFAEGNNIGMSYASENLNPDYVLLLNNDTTVDLNFLTELVNVAVSDPSIGIVGPKIYYYDETDKVFSIGGKINAWTGRAPFIGWGKIDHGQFEEIREVDYVSGCALLIKQNVIKKIGLLNTEYFSYSEDAEWCVKARKVGHKIICVPKAKLWHKIASTAMRSKLYLYYITRNRFLFMRRNFSKLQFLSSSLFFFVTYFPFITFLNIYRRDLPSMKTFYKAIYDGIMQSLKGLPK